LTLVFLCQVVKSSPYFEVQPLSGIILGGNDVQLLVRYSPKAMGRHTGSLPVQVYSEDGHLVQEVILHLTGTSLRHGGKAALVGGTNALPGDFTRPKKFVDGEQVRLGALARELKPLSLTGIHCPESSFPSLYSRWLPQLWMLTRRAQSGE
jgi:hypothetical protein